MNSFPLSNKLHVVYFMKSGHLRISRNDLNFLDNIERLLHNKLQVTSNQVNLMNKILEKYERQLVKHGIYAKNLIELPWEVPIVESSYQYTNAFIKIEDNQILLKCPYNKKFIIELRSRNGNEAFVWNKIDRRYQAPFSTYNLKLCIDVTFMFFDDANCCNITTGLIDSILSYEQVKYWNPTLVKLKNNNFIIAADNEHLNSAIHSIPLNDDYKSIVQFVAHGIDIADDIKNKDKFYNFCSNYESKVEITDIEFLIDALVKIGADKVYISSGDANSSKSRNDLLVALKNANIPIQKINPYFDLLMAPIIGPTNPSNHKFPVYIRFKRNATIDVSPVAKIVTLTNSNPINIK